MYISALNPERNRNIIHEKAITWISLFVMNNQVSTALRIWIWRPFIPKSWSKEWTLTLYKNLAFYLLETYSKIDVRELKDQYKMIYSQNILNTTEST